MKQPRLPFIKLMSKIVRFPKAEVDAYLAQTFQIKANGQGRNKQDCEGVSGADSNIPVAAPASSLKCATVRL